MKGAVEEKQFLYKGAAIWDFGINSNSVWNTFLKSLGVARPQDYGGPLATPGAPVDLRNQPSNNPAVREKRSDAEIDPDDLRTTVLLLKPASEWRQADADHVAASAAYSDRGHSEHDAAIHALAKYRDRRASGLRTADDDGPVHVDAYERRHAGASVQVEAHWRHRPRG